MSIDGWTASVGSASTPEEKRVADIARELGFWETKLKQAKEKHDALKDQLLAHMPEDIGEHMKDFDGVTIRIKRGEKLNWDSDILEQMYATRAVPDFVDQKFRVPKKKWDGLDDADKQALLPALTRAPGAVSISIEE